MNQMKLRPFSALTLLFILLFTLSVAAACSTNTTDTETTTEEEQTDEHQEGDDHAHPADRIPNNGAVIRFVSPTDGAVFKTTDEIPVQVEVENFDLTQDSNHWHISVDGTEWLMVMSGDLNDVIRGLTPGEHEVEVTLSTGEHQDLEEGDTITITIEE